MSKVRQYRIVIRNFSLSDDRVCDTARRELGDVQIVDWRLEKETYYEGMVTGGGIMPQRDSHVIVKYKECRGRRTK
ncbi:hypothetical protein A3H75_00345 [Candidatus Uhrbacteria bacterium RIFCSPLOWO2_02_FULL_51_9]|uniref:Uncharacterized protein n=1 Tax=Candidatus Uhrbacteria bacterium RIFCSPLOWO2_02_FULL_51_9 TaxID=1802410 RepID=A0A1F7VDE5_9BACT|nr:MAG: hypothetical protein A3H75_00345 [Candidatus Uhrbacteria bacterium RIFCSPLOWO2_02_FULL_51_9]